MAKDLEGRPTFPVNTPVTQMAKFIALEADNALCTDYEKQEGVALMP